MKSTGVVICNYNKSSYVLNCIQSVLESKEADFDIYVVDNASTDDSVAAIQKQFPTQVTLFVNETNLGGSGGFNTGIRYVVSKGYEYVWCLDNDTLVDENAFLTLKHFLDEHKDCGMAGSKIYHMQESDFVQQYGITIDFDSFCVEAKYLNEPENGSMPPFVYSDAVAACSVLVRTSLIQKIGPMPEENFLYWDDTEWGMRANLSGSKVVSVGASMVLHEMGAKKEVYNTFATYYAWRNWIVFFIKYTPEHKLESMCHTFLTSIFEIIYTSRYNLEHNKAKTIMAAYDDAIHFHMGKASSDKIFALDKNDEKLKIFAAKCKNIIILSSCYDDFAQSVKEKLLRFHPALQIEIVPSKDYKENPRAYDTMHSSSSRTVLRICSFIFQLEDLSCQDAYIDLDWSLFTTKEEALMILNYLYSKESFLFAEMPLFLRQVSELRSNMDFLGSKTNTSKNLYVCSDLTNTIENEFYD